MDEFIIQKNVLLIYILWNTKFPYQLFTFGVLERNQSAHQENQ